MMNWIARDSITGEVITIVPSLIPIRLELFDSPGAGLVAQCQNSAHKLVDGMLTDDPTPCPECGRSYRVPTA